jgi:hypothetical protein
VIRLDHNDHNWEKDLSPPPLQKKGFDDKLRRRIEDQLDRKEERRRRWLWPAVSFCSIAALSAFVWLISPFGGGTGGPEPVNAALTAAHTPGTSELSSSPQEAPPAPVEIKTGVLIGLRLDYTSAGLSGNDTGHSISTYRTLMLAPVDGQVSVAAEGSGILVPYGQKFWKIDAMTHKTDTDMIHYLSVHPADKPAEAASFVDDPDEQLQLTEKLLFAGNQYLSVAEEEDRLRGSLPIEHSQVWVRKLNQVPQTPAAASPVMLKSAVNHVTVQDIFGEGAQQVLSNMMPTSLQKGAKTVQEKTVSKSNKQLTGDNWAIIRQPGRWVAQVAETFYNPGSGNSGYALRDYPAELPDVVTSHDQVASTWGQIKTLQANAKDLLSSPLEDMIIVQTDKELVLYSPGNSGRDNKPLLHVELEPGEELVSAQWATGSYVGEWVVKARKYLQETKAEER